MIQIFSEQQPVVVSIMVTQVLGMLAFMVGSVTATLIPPTSVPVPLFELV